MVHVKISGLTLADQATRCVELGAAAIGLTFCANSPRQVTVESALEIARAARAAARVNQAHVDVVGIVADMPLGAMRALAKGAELDCLELAGSESPDVVFALLPHAYKAVHVATNADLLAAGACAGDYLLVHVDTANARLDWAPLRALAQKRRLTLAGGLHPGNVRAAVAAVRPFCVDVTSGVERSPGDMDLVQVERFIVAAKSS
jgi:phosphoribosylanthranilate isomerase